MSQLFDLFEAVEVVVQEHFSVVNGVFGTHENEGDVTLLPGDGGFRFVVAFDLDTDHTGLVNNLLNESTVLTNDFAHITSRNLK